RGAAGSRAAQDRRPWSGAPRHRDGRRARLREARARAEEGRPGHLREDLDRGGGDEGNAPRPADHPARARRFGAPRLILVVVFLNPPSGLMRACQPLLSGVRLLFLPFAAPLVKLAGRAASGSLKGEPGSAFDRGGIHYLLTAEDEAGALTEGQRDLAGRVLLL